jgi:alkanesulfonate monooxygenase SsuD/methylene tetrahydromethanopterin reductase-like flavin-dependent oxidoreductase (luciferase family)
MIDEEAIDEKELAFLAQLEEHENEWVAFIQEDGAEIVVGSGKDAVEAIQEAEKRGFPDAVLMKVPPFDRGLIPSNFS